MAAMPAGASRRSSRSRALVAGRSLLVAHPGSELIEPKTLARQVERGAYAIGHLGDGSNFHPAR